MNIITTVVRPDTLTKGDYVYSTLSKCWEPVKDAYWDEQHQRYFVTTGCLPDCGGMMVFGRGIMVEKRNYYS